MEEIQSAIARARASRSVLAAASPLRIAEVPAYSDAARIAAAWQALPSFIPDVARLEENHIVAYGRRNDATPFNVMRTKLLQQMRANNWRRLAITSPGAACGKSTIALNLGFSLGRQSDLRTVVAELDMRRPSLARTLGLQQKANFAQVLHGTARCEDSLMRHGTNLAFATNRATTRNETELLHSPSVPVALTEMEARYEPDIVIFDMPPMLVSDEMMAFAGQVDCVLLVAAAETTTTKEIDICERDLATQTNVMGVVLNKCRYMGPDYGNSYYR